MRDRQTIHAHFIHEDGGDGTLFREIVGHAPRVGDELRFAGDRYFTVTRLVWIFDEPESPFARLNIGIREAT